MIPGTRLLSTLLAVTLAMLALPVSAAEIDTATTRASAAGLFKVSFESRLDPIEISHIHEWVVHVATVDGVPVEDAAIEVAGGMPAHSHGLPTEPRMTRNLGRGDYLVEGLKFQMSGHWAVTLAITAGAKVDSVTFNLLL